jgi:uncharacterized protein
VARTISGISVAPVQGFALHHPDEVELTQHGVLENRRFLLVDDHGLRVRSSLSAWPCLVRADYDTGREVLRVTFADGRTVEESALGGGERVTVDFSDRAVSGRLVRGDWEHGLAALAGHPVRIVRSDVPGARQNAPVTLLSEASVARLAWEAGRAVDDRRFRMLFRLAGCDEHEEDTWDGRRLRVGGAVLRAGGPVTRCAVTTRDPDTGERDLDALALIKAYRGAARTALSTTASARGSRSQAASGSVIRSNYSREVQLRGPRADEEGMARFLLSLFRRTPRRRIAVLHGPRHA